MVNITVNDIVNATNGQLLCGDGGCLLNELCTDSRAVSEGDLFIPIIGAKVDAHRFIDSVLEKGAATLLSEDVEITHPDKAYIKVEDTEKALQSIGRYIRARYSMPIVGVTGSVGKTTTREMIAAAIGTAKNCYQTKKNLNSQIGVPLTLSDLDDSYEAAVVEMGISEPDQMNILSEMVKPDMCVVTVIGVAHIETLHTKENIRNEKLKITHGMKEGGTLFLNADDAMLYEVKDELPYNIVTYGLKEDADFRGTNIRTEDNLTIFDCIHQDEVVSVRLNAMGRHNVRNALAGMAVAYSLGIPVQVSATAFEHFVGQRQNIIRLEGRYTIIDDTYNASPDSMRASIDVLCDMECSGRRIAVLGDMLELGENSPVFHKSIGEYLKTKKIDEVIVVGENSREIKNVLDECDSFYGKAYYFSDNEEVAIYLMAIMKPEDVVLVKGSNGMKLKDVVNILMN